MILLDKKYLDIVKTILQENISNHEVRMFGSRVNGTPKPYSDIDLVIMNDVELDRSVSANLSNAFDESDLPYKVDLVQWAQLSDEFKKVISSSYEII